MGADVISGAGTINGSETIYAPLVKPFIDLSARHVFFNDDYTFAVGSMLGVTQNRILGPADRLLQKAAEAAGRGETFYRTSVGIFQAAEGVPGNKTFPDPFFGGEGPPRTTCTACGGCLMGCRFGAKSTLDLTTCTWRKSMGPASFQKRRL